MRRAISSSVVIKVRHEIERCLWEGDPSIASTALALNLSVRTMQRRLNAEGTSFSDVFDDVRRNMALSNLNSSGVSLGELSTKLGYKRQSNFTRSVRRWTGATPSEILTRR